MNTHQQNIRTIWRYAGPIKVIQKAVQQRPGEPIKCAQTLFNPSAIYSKYEPIKELQEVGYLRIAYASIIKGGHVQLPDEPLVDYIRWEDDIKHHHGVVENVWRLLVDAKENGVPIFNTLKLQIDEHGHFPHPLSIDGMRLKLHEFTLLAVMEIREDYSANGEVPYMGRGEITEENDEPCHHAVVIVGEYMDDTLFKDGENVEPLWIYQNSDGDKDASFLGNGLNVVRHDLLREVYCAETYATSLLLHQYFVPTVKPYRTKPRVNI